ncbi:MAG: NADP-dependent phosphogluconate dehydrogenase [Saprospiraceae bacterium]|nr:NADP-dependent phosphogluconate dehydrogenase [Saprospiraceae bacterium]
MRIIVNILKKLNHRFMSKNQLYDFGIVGLGVMGRNFLLNVADHGYSIIGLDTNKEQAQALVEEASGKPAKATTDMKDFVKSLKTPRKIMLLVPAGKTVDIVIDSLLKYVEPKDVIIDGGNSFFEDTERRLEYLKEKKVTFLGVGVSGGAKGARLGPSIMPGGSKKAYNKVKKILEAVSAKVNGEPCVAYMGKGSAGNYVKMVHNGIEYAMMQLLAESYDILKNIGGLNNEELHQTYKKYNRGKLKSFLIEITAEIFTQKDDLGKGMLIDKILDKAKQKGTGKWTSQNAMEFGVPVPTIDAAVTMRGLSSLKNERLAAEKTLNIRMSKSTVDKSKMVKKVGDALFFAFITAYSQGMALLTDVSKEKGFGVDLESTARIWRGGCIIRASLLEDIRKAYSTNADLPNLMMDKTFARHLKGNHNALRYIIKKSIDAGIPTLAFSTSLAYFDAYRDGRLPLNLTQAQRDHFGSHTYERIDKDGTFHTEWK